MTLNSKVNINCPRNVNESLMLCLIGQWTRIVDSNSKQIDDCRKGPCPSFIKKVCFSFLKCVKKGRIKNKTNLTLF